MSALLDEAQRVHRVAGLSDRIIAAATGLVVRAEAIPVWLNRPVIALDDEKPIESIARGDCKRIARLIAEIEYPLPHRGTTT